MSGIPLLGQETCLSVTESVGIGLELCGELSALHAGGRGHGGLALDSIARSSDGRLKITVEARLGAGPEEDVLAIAALMYRLVGGEEVDRARWQPGELRRLRPDVPVELVDVVDQVLSGAIVELADLRAGLAEVPGRAEHASLWLPFGIVVVALLVVGVVYYAVPDRLGIDAVLFTRLDDADAPFDLALIEGGGPRQLCLRLMATDEAHAYVIGEDSSGLALGVFDGPLPEIRKTRLPVEGWWSVDYDHLVLVVVRRDFPEVASSFRGLLEPDGDPFAAAVRFRRAVVSALGRAGQSYADSELPPSLVELAESVAYGGSVRVRSFRLR